MNLPRLLLMIANAGGWGNLSLGNVTTDDLASTFSSAVDDNMALDIRKLDTNKVVIAYAWSSTGGTASNRVVVAQVDPTTGVVTFGTPFDFGAVFSDTTVQTPYYKFGRSIAILSTTSFVLGWTDSSGNGKCAAYSVSGTTITAGTTVNIQTTSAVTLRYISAIALDSTRVIFTYRVQGTANMRAALHTISGTTMTYRSVVTISTVNGFTTGLTLLDATHVVVAFGNGSDVAGNKLAVLTYSGTTISVGTVIAIDSTVLIGAVSVEKLSSSSFLAMFNYGGTVSIRRYSVSGTTITAASSIISIDSLLPSDSSSVFGLVNGADITFITTEGSNTVLGLMYHIGSTTSTLRPVFVILLYNSTTDAVSRYSWTYLAAPDVYTCGGVGNTAFNFTVLNSKFIVAYGFINSGTTYTMRMFKVRV